jgi:uncharacterized protein (DUF1800 family)
MAQTANLGLIALTRFGYGPRGDGDVAIAASDPRGFLKAELAQPGIALLSGPALPSTTAAIQQFYRDQGLRKAEREQAAATAQRAKADADLAALSPVFAAAANADAAVKDAAMRGPGEPSTMIAAGAQPMANAVKLPARPPSPEQIIFRDEALARLRRAIEARVGLAERLVAFWSNHFCVSANKGGIARITAGAFEREAIRPHVLGKFSDMLIAVESHPAMLHFLDNAQSVGPNSKVGQRGKRGLNENLGREIMELHTMGAGSGYTQADVTNLARILTGWTYGGAQAKRGEPGAFVFNADTHEPGTITLLGTTYAEAGLEQGQTALLDIARRTETAHFIARKFARAFVSDEPPKPLVDRLAQVFEGTNGDLHALTVALIDAPEAWSAPTAKMRTPYEFIVATNRLLGHLPEEPGQVVGPLAAMGMGLWAPPGPNGYSDQAATWASPEGMKLRLDYCALVAGRIKDPPNPSDLLEALCGGAPSPQSRDAVSRAESRQQGLALLLMSPEMQRS